ncbi:uncharacterized protein LOC105634260 isoform X1 [Jatropha curcas]|uniref:uncharacterized protein LOC105634260 isoform X1 n=1 Tax=Jatropha curcas TaxID=180498 RepID=UPI001892E5D6|nr:uncharacterized protein LOC105634260 isoform X1 [Jatropha curcas]
MALSSAFRERLEHMEHTRNQRLSLLQAEKELQENNLQILASKQAEIRSMEQRCLLMDREIAFQNFKILALKSEIESLDARYNTDLHQLRVLKSEIEELEQTEKEKEKFYELKRNEMKKFREDLEKFVTESKMKVNDLKNIVNELNSTFIKLQGNNGHLSNSEIAAAEMRKAELVAMKENLEQILVSNYQRRSNLQNQLEIILRTDNQEKKKFSLFKGNNSVVK